MEVVHTIGNKSLWRRNKTLFLCSKMAPIGTWGKVFEWVDSLTQDDTVVCFNSSEFETEVLKALLVNRIPTVLVVMNHFHDIYNVQVEQALSDGRILIMVLRRNEPRGKGTTPCLRNRYIFNQVEHTVCGHVTDHGTVTLIVSGHNNVTYLLDKKDLSTAAEAEPKPYRWTVAEDKRLLRMYYEDMGIHAIHKAIQRPYSTIYYRLKALTMNDELLKGREFEDYVLELFDVPHNNKLTLKEWRGDKSLPGVYPEGNSAPDFVFEYDNKIFAVECKWRGQMPKDTEKELLPPSRYSIIQKYISNHQMQSFLILGIGGLPNNPDKMYYADLSMQICPSSFLSIHPHKNILEKILHHL